VVTNRIGRIVILAAIAALLLLISGCLYPSDHTPGNRVSVRNSVLAVQDAVERYRESTGLLPIQNADASVPEFEKFKVDFGKLQRMGYMESIPKLAFENGGGYLFIVIDEERNPTVKLLDLAVHQTIASVQKKVDAYRSSGGDPGGTEAYPGFRYLDFAKLGMSQPEIRSMYSQRPLELMISDAGRVYADYGIDIAEALEKSEAPPNADEDLRYRLVQASDFVPVVSPVYKWVDDSPQAQVETTG
jgi:hypothetical protein